MQIWKKSGLFFSRILRRQINLKSKMSNFREIEKYYGVVYFDRKSQYYKKDFKLSHFEFALTQKQLRKRKLNMKFFNALPPSSNHHQTGSEVILIKTEILVH